MKISLILGGMCVALSCGIAIQVRTISRIGTTTSRNSTENELRDAILRTKENRCSALFIMQLWLPL